MPVLLGIILGILIAVGGAFVYDSGTGRAANGLEPTAAGGRPPVVNWDVLGADWRDVKQQLRNAGGDIEKGWRRLTG
jgi:hypothetical protein